MFKRKIGIAPGIMKNVSEIVLKIYNLRHVFLVKRHNMRSVRYRTETDSFQVPK